MTGWTRSRSRGAPPGGSRPAPSLIAVLEAIALIVLMPLKTVEPYTLLVDRQTGFVQALRPLDAERIAAGPGADPVASSSSMSSPARASTSTRSRTITARSPCGRPARRGPIMSPPRRSRTRESPLARYPRSTIVETRVKSVSPVGRDVAMVRFETRAARRRRPGAGRRSAWVAVIRYRYSGEPMCDRGPVRQPARLPGAALPAQRRGAAARGSRRRPSSPPPVPDRCRCRPRRRRPPSRPSRRRPARPGARALRLLARS